VPVAGDASVPFRAFEGPPTDIIRPGYGEISVEKPSLASFVVKPCRDVVAGVGHRGARHHRHRRRGPPGRDIDLASQQDHRSDDIRALGHGPSRPLRRNAAAAPRKQRVRLLQSDRGSKNRNRADTPIARHQNPGCQLTSTFQRFREWALRSEALRTLRKAGLATVVSTLWSPACYRRGLGLYFRSTQTVVNSDCGGSIYTDRTARWISMLGSRPKRCRIACQSAQRQLRSL
jgi:hypothetical protein